MMHLPRIFIAAAHKSSGKTTVSVGLARALTARGRKVRMFKKGPDYIDPLWHRLASGQASYNLDFNTQSRQEITALFASRAAGQDISIIEANKGLHDGLALTGEDSNAALAKLLDAPVVLVIDTEGITRGIAPLLMGYRAFDEGVHIAGVILNKVAGPRHEAKLRAAVEHYVGMEVLGAVRRSADMILQERHLGLTTPGDAARRDAWLDAIGERMAEQVDLERLQEIAQGAPAWPAVVEMDGDVPTRPANDVTLRLAVARDAAFCFTYADDLERFAAAGVELVFFSPMHDARLPENIDGLFLPGGFPETHMRELEANAAMRQQVARAIASGLPAYAECGGLMYLAKRIRWRADVAHMCGVVPAEAVMHERPRGRGIVHLDASGAAPWAPVAQGQRVQAHEFHYAALEKCAWADASFAWQVARGHGIDGRHDGLVVHNTIAGFAHLRHTRQSPWVDAFVRFMRQCRRRQA